MILRRWTARATAEGARQYMDHFRQTVLPELARVDGHQGSYLLQRVDGAHIELTVMTRWTSMDAIRAFAGDVLEKAVVEPRAQEVLASFDVAVSHHDVVVDTVG